MRRLGISVCRFAPAIRNTNHIPAGLHCKRNLFMNGSQHQGVQLAMVHGRGENDLGAGGAQLLELQDQMLQLGHAARRVSRMPM